MNKESWLALGDSITWGFPHGPSASWTAHAADALGLPVDNQGVNGDTLDGMYERLSNLLAGGRRYRLATVMGGSNDVGWGFRPEAMADHLVRIVALLQAAGTPVVVGLPPPIWLDPLLEERLVKWREHVRENFRPVVDFTRAFSPDDADSLPDGVHPSEAAYRAMADLAVPVLRSVMQQASNE